ncbi:flavodoxin [Pedobacter agri]|uniref:flavodoxin n=1 Tax=Pedobacter agri TaxID=454586 RepID=UPI00292EFF1E|nr:flavodoxin [Pedobacter agri]
MKAINIITPLLMFCILFSCTNAQEKPVQKTIRSKGVLIVYLSRTNNTKAIAEMIQQQVGGDLVAIEMQKPYPADYKTTVAQVANENESGFLPLLRTKIENIDQYDTVFVGFPTWGMALPPPMKSFLRQYNFKGKTIVPFNTNAGYGIGSTFETVKTLCPESNILEGFTTKGGIERDGELLAIKDARRKQAEQEVLRWLQKINIVKRKN